MGSDWRPLKVGRQTVLVRQAPDGTLQVGDTQNLQAEIAASALAGLHHPVHEVLEVLREQLSRGNTLETELAQLQELRSEEQATQSGHPLSLAIAAQSNRPFMLERVARNQSTPARVLARMALSPKPYGAVAATNPSLPKDARLRMLRAGTSQAPSIAYRSELDEEEQQAALTSPSQEVVNAASNSAWITTQQLERILYRVSSQQRSWIAHSGRLELCEVILEHSPTISERKAIAGRWMPTGPGDFTAGIGRVNSDKLVERILLRLAKDRSPEVLGILAYRNDLPLSVLDLLAKAKAEAVRYRVAAHKNCSPSILEQLLSDPSEQVAKAASKRLSALSMGL